MGENSDVKSSEFGMSRNLQTSHYYIMEGKAAVPVRWMAKECFSNKYSTRGVVIWCDHVEGRKVFQKEIGKDATKE